MHLRMGRSMPRISRNAPTRSYSHAKQPELKTLKKEAAESLITEKALEKQYQMLHATFDKCYLQGCQAPTQKCNKQPKCLKLARDMYIAWKQMERETSQLEREIAILELPPSIFIRKK